MKLCVCAIECFLLLLSCIMRVRFFIFSEIWLAYWVLRKMLFSSWYNKVKCGLFNHSAGKRLAPFWLSSLTFTENHLLLCISQMQVCQRKCPELFRNYYLVFFILILISLTCKWLNIVWSIFWWSRVWHCSSNLFRDWLRTLSARGIIF